MLLGFVLFLLLSTLSWAAPPEPAIEVAIKKVDASHFPTVSVYFTVIDNVPSTAYYDLEDPTNAYNLTVYESPEGKSEWSDVNGTLKDSISRPMAATFAIDRSDSVLDTIMLIQKASLDWIDSMATGDVAALLFFAGNENCKQMYFHEVSGDKSSLRNFCQAHLGDTCGGTPMFTSWYLALGALEDCKKEDYPARGILSLTDGGDTSGNNRLTDLTRVAMSLDMPFYNIAFPKLKIDSNGIASIGGDIVPSNMEPISEATHGCYFEPIPPYPKLPDLPEKPEVTDDPEELDDGAVADYFLVLLQTLQLLIKNDDDAKFEDFKEAINLMLCEDCKVEDGDAFQALTIEDSSLDLVGIGALDWDTFNAGAAGVTTLAMATVTEADLDAFYNEQMLNMFNKIRTSLKKEYRLTFESPNKKLDGSLRDIKIEVAYTTHVNYCPVSLAGQATGRFVAPLVAKEDQLITQESSMDPASPIYPALFGGGAAPRGGTWDPEPTKMDWGVELYGRDEEGNPWLIATKDREDNITMNGDEDSPFYSVAQEDVTTYLEHIDMKIKVEGDTLTQKLYAFIPTCLASDLSAPQDDWPIGNEAAAGFRQRPLWYRVLPVASRGYSFTRLVPKLEGGTVVVQTIADHADLTEELPPLVTYVYDTTSPTLAVYATPRRGVKNRVEALEIDMDSEDTPRPLLLSFYGERWADTLSTNYSGETVMVAKPEVIAADFPALVLEDGTSTKGLFVRENERLELVIRARDNFDRAVDFDYMSDPENIPAPHNDYQDEDMLREDNGFDHWPFLERIKEEDIGTRSGYSASVVKGSEIIPIGPHHVFREANYPSGESIYLRVQASDQAGSITKVEIPVYVLPMGFDAKNLNWKSKRRN